MDKILGVLGAPGTDLKYSNDDDSSDKLSHKYTTALLIIFAVVVSTKQYVGNPIDCWVPAHFSGSWEEYANSYCWVKNTYYLPFEKHIPKHHEEDQRHTITYYQWVPLILLGQALFFFMPRMIWRTLNSRAGVDVDNVVGAAEVFQDAQKAEEREKTLIDMTKQMDRFLKSKKPVDASCTLSLTSCMSRIFCPTCGRRHGNYLIVTYLLVKVLFIINVISQIFILNGFIGRDYHLYGIEVLSAVFSGGEWRDSPRFPRVTMCDFFVRRLGNVQRYTVQCVLSINLFNEMIFLLLWFWMVFVAFASCLSLVRWFTRSIFKQDRTRYIKRHINLSKDEAANKELVPGDETLNSFVHDYLRSDGVFILRLCGHNTDALTVTEFITEMWKHFRSDPVLRASVEDKEAGNDGETHA